MNIFAYPQDVADSQLVEGIFKNALKVLKQKDCVDVEINYFAKEEIQEVNNKQRGKNEVTDVLSFPTLDGIRGIKLNKKKFPHDVDPETNNIFLGTIIICLDRAKEQSDEFGHSFEREVAYLALHGFLHLLGYDHIEEEDKMQMRKIEEKVLEELNLRR